MDRKLREVLAYSRKLCARPKTRRGERAVIVSVAGLGDTILTTPLAQRLNHLYESPVGLIAPSESCRMLMGAPFVGQTIALEGSATEAECRELLKETPSLIDSDVYSSRTPLALMKALVDADFTGNFFPNPFFERLRLFERPFRLLGARGVRPFHKRKHIVEHLLDVTGNWRRDPSEYSIALPREPLPSAIKAKLSHASTRCLVAVHVGGSQPIRKLKPQLIAELTRKTDGTLVLIGSASDARAYAIHEPLLAGKVINLMGQLTLRQTAFLLGEVAACVAPDSVIMHMAVACSTPLVALMGNEVPEFIGPWRGEAATVVLHRQPSCSPCQLTTCSKFGGYSCVQDISSDEIAEALHRVMARR